MKKLIYTLILPLIVGSGLVFANLKIKNEASKKPIQKPLSAAETKAALKKWEATPDGVMYKKWEASPAGKKVYDGAVKISKNVKNYTNMEAVVTSLSLPPGSRLGFGMMVRIDGEDYILAFGAEKPKKNILSFNNEFEQLHNLKVNDKIIIKSHSIMQAPKYSYPIITGDYVERDRKIMYKRESHKDDC
ncbi:hypothetical protein SAMN05421664_2646 [Chryseobacterium soldanellicola]|uniref:Uncharacterized protein n=1 Tax=Chryseobacterium soldanellicola TaxID=311333 RepID=A0A1H1DUJ8_9FLAO|nr:hypothetical protein [Chryseobacterium soldanellicola]SDQ80191.1 hypothetical protein SAMN05421664_2646 [Chryseobacterium soldanellicola]